LTSATWKAAAMTQSAVKFDPYSEEFFADPFPIYRRMREEAPVYYNEEHDFYALTRHADVAAAFKDYQTFSSARGVDLAMVKSDEPPQQAIIFMDPPDHRHMRRLLHALFRHSVRSSSNWSSTV
jgi:cytochrome P450